MGSRIDDILLGAKLVDDLQLRAAHYHQKQWGGRVADAVVEKGFAPEDKVVDAIGTALRVRQFNLDLVEKDEGALAKVPADVAKEKGVFPVALEDHGKTLLLAMADPTDIETIDALALKARMRIKTVLCGERGIRRAIELHYFGRETTAGAPKAFGQIERGEVSEEDEGKIVDLAGHTINKSIKQIFADAGEAVPASLAERAGTATAPPAETAAAPVRSTGDAAATLDDLLGDGPPAVEFTAEQVARMEAIRDQQVKAARIMKAVMDLCVEKAVFAVSEYRDKASRS